MTQSVTVIRDGFDFQARMFWMKAAWLLDDDSRILRVGFEHGPKGFDDIWVEYDPARCPSEQSASPMRRQHIQCKWHASPSTYGYADLINPDFINAPTVSLLQKAHAAQQMHAPDGKGVQFQLLTNWRVDEPFGKYIAQSSKTLRLDRLFEGKTDRSHAGQIRKVWREHLGIDDEALRILLPTLALQESSMSLEGLREHLNGMFLGLGLKCMHEGTFAYDEIVYDWMAQGVQEFDRKSFRAACDRQGLLQARQGRPIVYGVKSFEHPIDNLNDRCEEVLDLVDRFDVRPIRDQQAWATDLYPKLKGFLSEAARKTKSPRLALDAHATLAFAAGSVLNVKSGCDVELEQRVGDTKLWKVGDSEPQPDWAHWVFEHEVLNDDGEGLIVAVSVTHDAVPQVKTYLADALPKAKAILIARLSSGPGGRSVKSGQHAFQLAENLAQKVTTVQVGDRQPLHLFIAAPNTFSFFLGQRQPLLGKSMLYEYDLEGAHGATYSPSLSLPL